MYSPTEVPSGKICRCICPGCKEPLIARHAKLSDRVSHFAHAPGSDCSTGVETAVHLAAKQLIEQERAVFTPLLIARVEIQDALKQQHKQEKVIDKGGVKLLPVVRLEERIRDIRPDIIGTMEGGQDLCIEVAVTHFVADDKLAKIQKEGIPAVEFDLSGLREFTWASLRKALLEGSVPVEWLYHPEINRLKEVWMGWYKPILEEAEKEAQRKAEALEIQDEQQRAEWRRTEELYRQEAREKQRLERRERAKELARAEVFRNATEEEKRIRVCQSFNRDELPISLRAQVAGEQSFGVAPHIWQAALFRKVIHRAIESGHWGIHKDFAVKTLQIRFDIKPKFPAADEIAVWKYLVELTNRGALRRTHGQQFEILIADLSSFEVLQEYRHGISAPAKGLKWADEANWPNERSTRALAKAHGGGNLRGIPSSWQKVASINSSITQISPVEAVTRYSQTVEERALVTYWISAGFLVRG